MMRDDQALDAFENGEQVPGQLEARARQVTHVDERPIIAAEIDVRIAVAIVRGFLVAEQRDEAPGVVELAYRIPAVFPLVEP